MAQTGLNFISVSIPAGSPGVSDAFNLANEVIMGIITPDSFGATSIGFQVATRQDSDQAAPTYKTLCDGSNGNAIAATVDASTGKHYDITTIAPTSFGTAKLTASIAGAKTVTVVTRGI